MIFLENYCHVNYYITIGETEKSLFPNNKFYDTINFMSSTKLNVGEKLEFIIHAFSSHEVME